MANKSASVSIECEWFLSAPTAINQFTEQIFHPFRRRDPTLSFSTLSPIAYENQTDVAAALISLSARSVLLVA